MVYGLEAAFLGFLALRWFHSRWQSRIRHYWRGLQRPQRADAALSGGYGTARQALPPLARIAASPRSVMLTIQQPRDGASRILSASPFMEHIFGITATAVQEDAALLFGRIHADDLASTQRSQAGSALRMEQWHVAFRWHHPDGAVLRVVLWAIPRRCAEGGLLWHGYLYDLTEAAALRRM